MRISASVMARLGITPNAISIASAAFGLLAGLAFASTSFVSGPLAVRVLFLAAAACIQLRLLCNLLDGMVAVEHNKRSPVGDLYNDVPDRLSDAATLIGAGYAMGSWIEGGYLAAVLAVSTAYVRTLGKSLGHPSDYCGPMAKPQRMATLTAASAWLGIAPASWHPALSLSSSSHERGLLSIALAVIVLGTLGTCILRLRRLAARMRTASNAESSPCRDAPTNEVAFER